ncbi:hypothetical protein WG922_21580 [Ramlibacter sp. AN1015]|uniref:hypothetical protein n=1 Tax=Ramlibacter sp. AN1015 TaxID=3133428 RepID=UPI0030BC4048
MKALDYSHNSVTFFHQEDDKTIIGERVNVDGNLDRVRRLRDHAVRSDVLGDCMASIPLAAVAQWGQQFGITMEEVVADDSLLDRCIADYSKFKVKGGVF